MGQGTEVGTRENPVPMGTSVDLGDGWQIKVLKVYPNATDIMVEVNSKQSLPLNITPESGKQYFLATVEITYTGSESSYFDKRLLKSVGLSSIGYVPIHFISIPNELQTPETFTDGTTSGNVGWSIQSSDADALVMYYIPLFRNDNERVYMALYD